MSTKKSIEEQLAEVRAERDGLIRQIEAILTNVSTQQGSALNRDIADELRQPLQVIQTESGYLSAVAGQEGFQASAATIDAAFEEWQQDPNRRRADMDTRETARIAFHAGHAGRVAYNCSVSEIVPSEQAITAAVDRINKIGVEVRSIFSTVRGREEHIRQELEKILLATK